MKVRLLILSAPVVLGAALASIQSNTVPIKLIYNPSPSAEIGFYKISKKEVYSRGDFVAALLPTAYIQLATERQYLPKNTPVLKTVAATNGDEICVETKAVFINQIYAVSTQIEDTLGRPMPVHQGCLILKKDEFFLLSTAIQHSFDSRYFGSVDEEAILGVATPLLIFSK